MHMEVFFDGIDFLTEQHKAKNVIGCKFPKNEKRPLAHKIRLLIHLI